MDPESIPLLELPHARARAALATGAPAYLAVNPVEYHGPHLPLDCDALLCAGATRDLHARLAAKHPDWPLLFAGSLAIGAGVTPGPGSRHTPFARLRREVLGACRALVALGARRAVLVTFHGNPLHNLALDAGVRFLARHGVRAVAPMNVLLGAMLDLDPTRFADALGHVEDPEERRAILAELARDLHAGFFETSLALHYAPRAVAPEYRALPPCPPVSPRRALALASRLARALGRRALAAELDYAAWGVAWYGLRPFPAYTGRPHRASAESGRIFAEAIADRWAACADDVFAGRAEPPRPIMRWLRAASLGGRVGPGVL